MTKNRQRRRSSTTSTTSVTYDSDDADTYSTSLYARRNSLTVTPSVRRTSLTAAQHRRHSTSSILDSSRSPQQQHRRGSLPTTKERLCAFLRMGSASHHQNSHSQPTGVTQQRHRPTPPQLPSQYTYCEEPTAEYDNRPRPLRNLFARRRRSSENHRANAKHELLVTFAMGKVLLMND